MRIIGHRQLAATVLAAGVLLVVALTLPGGATSVGARPVDAPRASAARLPSVVRAPSLAVLRRYHAALRRDQRLIRRSARGQRPARVRRLAVLRRRRPAGVRVAACGGPSRAQVDRYVRAVLRALDGRSAHSRARGVRRAGAALPAIHVCGVGGPVTSTGPSGATQQAPPSPAAGRVHHVFTIVLENAGFAETFGSGQATAPYLSRQLPAEGALLTSYYGTGHNSLDNYVAMISGQGPNPKTQGDCTDPSMMGDAANPSLRFDADGQAIGTGCTYPASVGSLATQLTDRGLLWKGYMEDMNAMPGKRRTTCQGPGSVPDAGAPSTTAKTPDDYAVKHNPFVYFHGVTHDQVGCDARDVALPQLALDLTSTDTTPAYSFIVPNLCNDGHDKPTCADGSTGGLGKADAWLAHWVPMIEASPAFKRDGLLLVIFDEADGDSTACCAEPKGPNLSASQNNGGPYSPPVPGAPPDGGGLTGAVAVSRFIAPGTRSTVPYNHFSYLRSMEDLFGLAHLGYAARPGLQPFGPDVFTADPGAAP